MKRILISCLRVTVTLVLLLVTAVSLLAWWQWEGVREIIWEYKAGKLEVAILKTVRDLPEVDEVMLLRVSDQPHDPKDRVFGKSYYGQVLYETKAHTLKGPEARTFAALWRQQVVFPNGVMCHEPHHVALFFHEAREVGRAVICFQCTNAAIPMGVLGDGLMGFDSDTPQFKELQATVERLVGAEPAS